MRSAFADNPVIARILPGFFGSLDARVQALRAALAANQFEELRRLAHQIKGAGGSYGYPSITEAARKLEADAREGRHENAAASAWMLCDPPSSSITVRYPSNRSSVWAQRSASNSRCVTRLW